MPVPKSKIRFQLAWAVNLTHPATVKSLTPLTTPAGTVAYPPDSFTALPVTPGWNACDPVMVAERPLPEPSAKALPVASSAWYQRMGATTFSPTVPAGAPPGTAARTVAAPVPAAVYRPVWVTVPPPVGTVQTNDGCATIATPNWSTAVAVSCAVAPAATVVPSVVTVTAVAVWFTVTVTLLDVDSPDPLVMVTANAYVPALVNVATVVLAPLVLLTENATAAGGVPAVAQA